MFVCDVPSSHEGELAPELRRRQIETLQTINAVHRELQNHKCKQDQVLNNVQIPQRPGIRKLNNRDKDGAMLLECDAESCAIHIPH